VTNRRRVRRKTIEEKKEGGFVPRDRPPQNLNESAKGTSNALGPRDALFRDESQNQAIKAENLTH